ncbi:Protein of unknown function DUF58 [Filimonas lacunae]|uniref:DUF58 domain-containing protein n=1 Tax=Filimonas lacunae TaxID=477680 RepID=A0A173MQ44_9BACT|nr:DUF58 domain-containing protein [Filimonas lacunae]BAV09501.1 hypothetical protein FLA_5550 [Filimonas lacunae]SIS74299.1 Protein of unknown function DUF58 [Filimonas lacunae]
MSRLLDPAVLMAIKDLPLAAKTTIDGFMSGLNKSNVKGPGLEFSQYRSYQPGDDLRWLDWKMYARSDRYYIRESETETSISVRFLIDASGSMAHKDGAFSKMDYARYLAASLGWLAALQGDAIGLYAFQNQQLYMLPSRKDPQHMNRFFYQLEQLQPEGHFTTPIAYNNIFTNSQQKELLIFISDLYQPKNEISPLLEALAAFRHEVIVLHLMARNELDMDYAGYTTLQDLETQQTIPISSPQYRQEYQQKLQAWLQTQRKQLLEKNISYRMMTMNEPIDKALNDFLQQRKKSIL